MMTSKATVQWHGAKHEIEAKREGSAATKVLRGKVVSVEQPDGKNELVYGAVPQATTLHCVSKSTRHH